MRRKRIYKNQNRALKIGAFAKIAIARIKKYNNKKKCRYSAIEMKSWQMLRT